VPSLSPSGNPGPNPSQVLSLNPSFNPWDSSSSTQLLWDDDHDGDKDKECRDDDNDDDDDDDNNDDDDDLIDVVDDDNLMRLQNFDLNDIEGMYDYKLMRMQRVHRNNARLVSLGLLVPMTSAASLSSDRSNSKKCLAPQDDVERRVQPTRNSKKNDILQGSWRPWYEEVSGGIKADISPDPLPLPQEMKKQKNNYEGWFAGHYPSPLQDGKTNTGKNGRATAFTTRMYKNAVNSGLPPDKQLVLGQMFDYFTDCTLGQVQFLADDEDYWHNEHYLKGRLTDDAVREHWRN